MGRIGAAVATALSAAVAFFALSELSSTWADDLSPTPIWLATASTTTIALAVRRDLRVWAILGGVVGGLATGLTTFDDSLRSTITPTLGNAVEASLITVGVIHFLGERPRIRRTSEAVTFLGIVAVACALGGFVAVLDTTSSVITDDRLESWWRWTLGDAVGEVHLVPLLLFAGAPNWFRDRRWGTAEFVAFLLAYGTLAVVSFSTDSPTVYLLVPLTLWMSIRFGPLVATATATASALFATTMSGRGVGPFIAFGSEPAIDVQAFNIAIGLSALIGGAQALRAYTDRAGLESSERWWRALGEAAFDGIGRVDADGIIVGANQRFADLAGIDHDVIVGTPVRDIVHDGDWSRIEEQRARFAAGEDADFEVLAAIDADGARRWMRVSARPIPPGGGFVFLSDVTDEREERLQRLAAEHRLATVEREQRDALAQALHDGPVQQLAAAIVRISTVRKTGGDHPDLELSQEIVERSVDHLRGTLVSLSEGDVGIADLDETLERSLRHLRSATGPDLTIDVERELRLPDHVARTVFDLCREAAANAMIHANASKVVVTVASDDDRVRVEVVDDGSGFDPDRRPEGERGHLGLRSMRTRAAELGGSLEIESAPGHGTTVRVRFARPDR